MRLALYQPDIPHNLGAAMRLCAAFDTALDIIEPCGFPLSDKAIRRTAMDYASCANVSHHSGWDAFRVTVSPGRLVLLTTKSASSLYDFTFAPGDILLMGRESAGVPDDVHAAADHRLFIPISAAARSINVVTAAAIALSEALRQTGTFPRRL